MHIISLVPPLFGWLMSIFGGLFLILDGIIYSLVEVAMELFLYVSQMNTTNLGGGIQVFLSRAMTLITVIMMFRIALSLFEFIINPDKFSESKNGGASIIKNVLVSVILLTLVQTEFPFKLLDDLQIIMVGMPSNELAVASEAGGTQGIDRFNYLGWIFSGADDSELKSGFLGRLAFGGDKDMASFSHSFAYNLLTAFLHPDPEGGGDPTTINDVFSSIALAPGSLMQIATLKQFLDNGVVYKYPIVSSAAGLYIIYLILSSAVDIGVRIFKLILLRMIAPIPAVAYIDAGKGQKITSSFLKTYGQIYLELFIKVFTLYMACIIAGSLLEIIEKTISENAPDGIMSLFFTIILIIAVFKFFKEAPKLLSTVFGIEFGNSSKKGFSSLLGSVGGFLAGGVGGLAAGIAGGAGIAGSLANAAGGAVSGARSGYASKNMGDVYRNAVANQGKNRERAGKYAAAGGLGHHMAGRFQTMTGTGNRQDKQVADAERQSGYLQQMNEKYDAANSAFEQDFFKSNNVGSLSDYEKSLENSLLTAPNSDFGKESIMYEQMLEGYKTGKGIPNGSGNVDASGNPVMSEVTLEQVNAQRSKMLEAEARIKTQAREQAKQNLENYKNTMVKNIDPSATNLTAAQRAIVEADKLAATIDPDAYKQLAGKENYTTNSDANKTTNNDGIARIQSEINQIKGQQSYKNTHTGK